MSNANRVPPHDLTAERATLSSILQDKLALDKVVDILHGGEDFYHEGHRMIYEAIYELNRRNEPFDVITVTSYLDGINKLDLLGGMTYVLDVANEVPVASHVESYARIVSEKAVLRKLIEVSSNIVEKVFDGSNSAENVLDDSEQKILDIANFKKKRGFSPVSDILHTTFDRLEMLSNSDHLTGVPTFKTLDFYLNGLQKSDMIICAARPGMGKTSFCLNIAENAALKENTPVAIFSLEMSKEQLVLRLLSSEALVDQSKLRSGNITKEDFESLSHAAAKLHNAPIYIDDTPGINVMELRGKARRLKAEHGLGLIIIDYIQLMQGGGNKNDNRQQEISDISRNLKLLARELDVPVLALSQLSRAVEQTPSKIPNLSHLRESGSLEQDSDVVLFIYRASYYDNEEENEDDKSAEIYIAKHRHGPTGKAKLVFLNEYTKFVDMDQSE